MRHSRYAVAGLLIFLVSAVSLPSSVARSTPQEQPESEWPRQAASADGTRWTVYQPQINTWEEQERFDGWVAVATSRPPHEETIVGALHYTAATETNLETRTVVAHDFQIVEANFPALDEVRTMVHRIRGTASNYGFPDITTAAGACEDALREEASREAVEKALEALLAHLAAAAGE